MKLPYLLYFYSCCQTKGSLRTSARDDSIYVTGFQAIERW